MEIHEVLAEVNAVMADLCEEGKIEVVHALIEQVGVDHFVQALDAWVDTEDERLASAWADRMNLL